MTEYYDQLEDIKSAVIGKIPFISSILETARILEKDLPNPASIDKRGWIFIDPEKMKSMEVKHQVFILAHETMHSIHLHAQRGRNKKYRDFWNFAVDCTVNSMLSSLLDPPEWVIMPHTISDIDGVEADEEGISKMTDEDVYNLLVDLVENEDEDQPNRGERSSSIDDDIDDKMEENPNYDGDEKKDEGESQTGGAGGKADTETGEDEEGEKSGKGKGDITYDKLEGDMVQEGSDFNDKEVEEKMEESEEILSDAMTLQKEGGKVPAGLERYIDDMLKPNIDMGSIIKQKISNGSGSMVVSDWNRMSRKHRSLPGNKMVTTPTVWTLVDTSGSISKDELGLFMGAVYDASSQADVKVIPWDADQYGVMEVRRKPEVMNKIASSLKGNGGTKIQPPLEKVLDEMNRQDLVVVLTDGAIRDIGSDGVIRLLKETKRLSSVAMMCTTSRVPDVDEWLVIEISER